MPKNSTTSIQPIITIPNPNLRLKSKPVEKIDKKIKGVLDTLRRTLIKSHGVGLAAPQIDEQWRIFATYLPLAEPTKYSPPNKLSKNFDPVKFFINPKIVKNCGKKTFAKESDGTYTLEGCLSVPHLFAPVPRYQWVEVEYQTLNEKGELSAPKREKFSDYFARNMQHEYDHLEGVLFTDYLRDNNIILYRENPQTGRLTEVEDLSFIYAF